MYGMGYYHIPNCRDRIRTRDIQDMSLTSYQTAQLCDNSFKISKWYVVIPMRSYLLHIISTIDSLAFSISFSAHMPLIDHISFYIPPV